MPFQNWLFIAAMIIGMPELFSVNQPEQVSPQQMVLFVNPIIEKMQTKNTSPLYLDKKDPIFIAINNRAVIDLKQSIKGSDTESPENKLMAAKMTAWPQEKKNQLEALAKKSIEDYIAQAHFNIDMVTYLMTVGSFGEIDQKRITEEYAVRVQHLGKNKYVAEFWEDGLAVNSEAHAIEWANKLAKRFPDDKGMLKDVKENYANVRKTIKSGKKDRYSKVMALLYTRENDGSISFHDPYQPMLDFINR